MKTGNIKKYIIPALGVIAVIIGMLPYFILQKKCTVAIRDELDGAEYVGYVLGAGVPFVSKDYYPEYLGGLHSESLIPPSFCTAILFRIFSPLGAVIANRFFLMLSAFAGMYLWLNTLTKKRIIALICGLLMAFLPFYTVYGLSSVGVPLALWAFYELLRSKSRAGSVAAFLSIALFGFSSSLAISGYAVLAVYGVWFLVALIFRNKLSVDKKGLILTFFGTAELFVIYVICNIGMIIQLIDPGRSFVSQRSESVMTPVPFFSYFIDFLLNGSLETPSLHKPILFACMIVIAVSAVYMTLKKKDADREVKDNFVLLCGLFVSAVLIALLTAFRNSEFFAGAVAGSTGAVKTFQFDRFTWFYPFIWYSALGLLGAVLSGMIKKYHTGSVIWLLLVIPFSFTILKQSSFKDNAMEFFRDDSSALTWNAYFCPDEFAEVAGFIEQETGMAQSEYRVGCLGIEPTVAFQAGFYTIDGYASNYELTYKHRFRKVIAAELEKNPYNRSYFDDWGNRCYIFSSEYYGYPFLSKYEHPYYADLELDTDALKDLGCRYLLAAGMIENAEEKGYRLCNVFDSAEYTYVIYLYEIL